MSTLELNRILKSRYARRRYAEMRAAGRSGRCAQYAHGLCGVMGCTCTCHRRKK